MGEKEIGTLIREINDILIQKWGPGTGYRLEFRVGIRRTNANKYYLIETNYVKGELFSDKQVSKTLNEREFIELLERIAYGVTLTPFL